MDVVTWEGPEEGRDCVFMLMAPADGEAPARPPRLPADPPIPRPAMLQPSAAIRMWELPTPPLATLSRDPAALDDAVDQVVGPVSSDDREKVRRALEHCITLGKDMDVTFRAFSEGRNYVVRRAIGRYRAPSLGAPARVIGMCQDVNGNRQADLDIRQTESARLLGQLTGGIAHDFNNLLTIILSNLEILSENLKPDHEMLQFVEPARRAASSGAELTARLLAFAQRQPLRPERIDLDSFLPSLREMAVRAVGPRCAIEVICAADLWSFSVDRAQLEGALLNLIVNARDAMPAGGTIAMEARNVPAGSKDVEALGQGDYVCVTVSDQGGGIAPELLDRVFEPFFTTKPVGKGTGLGLSMVQGFAQQSNGHVTIASQVGIGTRVAVFLPRVSSGTAAPVPSIIPGTWQPRPYRTLVVDDTPEVLAVIARMCRWVGLIPMPVASADEALKLLRCMSFDLLLTDVVLPGRFGGADIAREARRLQPGIRVLYTSGYSDTDIVNHAKLEVGAELLVKPYTRHRFLAAIRRVMVGYVSEPSP